MTDRPEPLTDRKLTPWKGFTAVFTFVFVSILLVAALITWFMPRTYLGLARVKLDSRAQAELFSSDAVLTDVAQRLDLGHVFAARFGETNALALDQSLDILRRSIHFQRRWSGQSPLLDIRAYSLKPGEAAQLANTIAEAGCARAGAGQGHMNMAILDRAVPATRPARPNYFLNLGLGALVGLILGVMAGGVGARVAVGLGKDLPRPGSPAPRP